MLSSTGGSNVGLQGGSGNSTLIAAGGTSVTMFGGTGNDSLSSSGNTAVTVVGGGGSDTLTSSGGTSVTMFGGTGNDSLSTTGGIDITLVGGTGNSTLTSSGGSSVTMFGGTGNDSLSASGGSGVSIVGGTANDTLLSSGGTSVTMFGGTGNDSLSASSGSDVTMVGGTGNSTLVSSGGSSVTMFGGTGNDSLSSTGGTDVSMLGGSGNATLTSSGGSSVTMFGGTGNDSMSSSGGTDVTMIGGGGNSTLISSGDTRVTMFGGTGSDSLSSTGGSTVSMVGGSGGSTLTSSGGSSVTMFGGTGNDSLSSTAGTNITMIGGSGNSTLASSGESSVTMFGGTGNDSLSSTGGATVSMVGGTGSDTLMSSGGTSVTMFGGTGNDSLSSTGGTNVTIVGGSGNDTLVGSGGSSVTLFGGTGNDSLSSTGGSTITLVGGTGSDTLTSSGGTSVTMFGGTGNDSLSSTGGTDITMVAGSGNSTLSGSGSTSVTMFGGTGNDSLSSTGGSSVSMVGGSGSDMLTSSGGTSVTMFGGTGNDSLSSTGGTDVTLVGGSGNDWLSAAGGSALLMIGGDGQATLTSSGGTLVTMFGGAGNDSLSASGDTSVTLIGGGGSDSLSASGDTAGMEMSGGGSDSLVSSGGSSVTLFGGAGNDTLAPTGGTGILLAGLQGQNVYEIFNSPISVTLDDLATFGQAQPQTDSQTQGTNTILFVGFTLPTAGIVIDLSNASAGAAPTPGQAQEVAPGIFVTLVGQFQKVVGTPGPDYIHGGTSAATLNGGAGGDDTLIAGSGPAMLVASSGDDSLVAGTGGTAFQFGGNPYVPAGADLGSDIVDASAGGGAVNTLDFSQLGSSVTVSLAPAADGVSQPVSSAPHLALTLKDPAALNALVEGTGNDSITGNASGDTFYVGTGNDTITGGGGSDTFVFSGSKLGTVVINETTTTNALNFYRFAGPVSLNLQQPGTQVVDQRSTDSLTLTLPNPSAFNEVVGSPYGGTIVGNDNANETLIGGGGLDSIVAGSGDGVVLQAHVNQVVYLDFPSAMQTRSGDHVYTAAEESAILQGMQRIYAAFNYSFTLDAAQAQQMAQLTGGSYITQVFNAGAAGGSSSELDPHDLDLSGASYININPFMDYAGGSVPSTEANIVGLTTTIAAHELGHLSGLQHQEALGPIGSGANSATIAAEFLPTYPGPETATQAAQDIMASPASVGTTLLDAAQANGPTYLGERDAIKLAFNATGTVLQRTNLPAQSVSVAVTDPSGLAPAGATPFTIHNVAALGTLPALAVPNTLPAGLPDSGKTIAVTAFAVNNTIFAGNQEDFYSFTGLAGELMNFQVISGNNTQNPAPFAPEVLLVGPSGQVIAYNRHEFESSDSTLLDVSLPQDGTYYVGVDSANGVTTGNYQLFGYSFVATTAPSTAPGDTLVAGGGTTTMVGSSGNDVFQTASTGQATVVAGSGQAVVNQPAGAPAPLVSEPAAGGGSVTVVKAGVTSPTTTTVTGPTAATYGGASTYTAAVTAGNGQTPTGTVVFVDQTTGQTLGSAPLLGGQATLATSGLGGGTHAVAAIYVYSGSQPAAFQNATSAAPVNVSVAVATPTVQVSDAGGTYNGSAFAATATVTGASGTATSALDGVAPTLTYYTGSSATGTPLAGAPRNVGTYTVVASWPADQDYAGASKQATFTINPAPLTVTATGVSKVYDGSTTASVTLGDNALGGDQLALSYTGAAFADKNAGTAKSINVSGIALGGADAGNYQLQSTTATASAAITPAPLTVTATGVSKTYDGTTAATVVLSVSPLKGDQVTASGTAAFVDPGIGTGKTINVSGITLGGADGANYTLQSTTATTSADITPATLTVTANDVSKGYGADMPALTDTISGFVGKDGLGAVSGAADLETTATGSSTVGDYTITAAQGTLSAANYTFTFKGGTLHVTPAQLVVTADAQTKVYGGADPALTYAVSGLQLGDSAAAVLGGAPSRAAGENVGGYLIGQGSLAANSNYAITFSGNTLTITPATLAVSADPATKTYGQPDPALTYHASGFQFHDAGATVLSGLLSRAAGENVGGYALTQGTLAANDNYTIAFTGNTLTVTPAMLTVTAAAATRVYGADNPAFGATIAGFVNGDGSGVVSGLPDLSTTATTTSGVGTYPIVPALGTLSAANYTFAFAIGALSVTPATLAVTAADASKVYGTSNPAFSASVTGFVAGDDIGVVTGIPSVTSGATTSSGVGGYDIVAAQGTLSAANYIFAFQRGTLTVNPAVLTVAPDSASKVYGSVNPTFSDTISGFVNNDAGSAVSGAPGLATAATPSSHVGTYAVTATRGTLSAANYTFAFANGVLTITPAPLTVTADAIGKVYGQADPTLTYKVHGFQVSDTAATVLTGLLTRADGQDVGGYPISQGTLAADNDYTLSFAGSTLTITPAPLSAQADAKTKVYGQTDPALTYQASGFQFSDTAATVLSGGLTRAAGEGVGNYAIGQGSLTANSNYVLGFTGGALAITPAPLTVKADPQTKVYGQSDPALTYQAGGFQFSDNAASVLTGGLARRAGESVAGGPYAIGQGALAANGNYTIAFTGSALTITPAPLTVKADPQTKVYGQPDPALTYQASGFQFSDTAATVLSGGLTRAAGKNVGDYAIAQGTLAANSNYTLSFTGNTLTVTPAPLTVTADPHNKVFGQANPTLTDTITGFVNGDTSAVVSGLANLSTTATQTSAPGPYPIAVSQGSLGAANYDFRTFVGGTLTVSQDGTGTTLSAVVSGQTATLTATVAASAPGSGTPTGSVDFKDVTTGTDLGTVVLNNGSATLTPSLPTGTQTITATYSGDSDFVGSSAGTAVTVGVTGPSASVYVLDPTGSAALSLSGNADINVPGDVVVESSSPTALTLSGNAQITAPSIEVVGGVAVSGHAGLSSSPVHPPSGSPGDPLAGLPAPPTGTSLGSVNVSGNSSLTIPAGTYSQISVSGNGKLTMAPGVYVVTSGGFTVSGNGSVSTGSGTDGVTGSGALIYDAGGAISLGGNGRVSLMAPSLGTTYAGIVLFQPGGNAHVLTLSGNAAIGLNGGLVYAPAALLSVSGNGDLHGTPLIVKDLQITGNALANSQLVGGTAGGQSGDAGPIALAGGAVFTTVAQAITAGRPSTAMTVQLVDGNNNPIVAGQGGVTLALGSTSAGGWFLDADGNLLPGSTITIPTGAGAATFEYEDSNVGFPTLTATAPNIGAAQQESVSAGTPVYSPAQVRAAYGINKLTWDGTGQTIAIIDAYDDPSIFQSVDAFDLQFASAAGGSSLHGQYGPASSFLTVLNQDGGTVLPTTDPTGAGTVNWEVEEALDVEWAHAMAPGARIVLVEANSQSLPDLMAAVGTAADLPGVSVVSMSWGFVEGQDVLAQDEARYDHYFTTPAGHEGVTFVASTGDYGAGVPQYPAFSPNVVSVGGTSLAVNTDNSYNSEVGWGYYDGATGTFVGGGGGGISQFEAEPAFQQGVQSTGRRTTPDVSFVADPNTGTWVVDSYNLAAGDPWEIVGGTSLSAPSWAGLLALVNQGRTAAGSATLGTAGPTEAQTALYSLGSNAYHDITAGSNGYLAGVGYDLATGLGSPVANVLVPDLVAYARAPAISGGVAPIAPAGLVLNANVTYGGSPVDTQVAALKVFDITAVVTHVSAPAASPGSPENAATGPAMARPRGSQPASTGVAPDRAAGARAAGVRPVVPATPDVPAAGSGLSSSAPVSRGSGPTGTDGDAAWSAALLDVTQAPAPLPGLAAALRPEMPADGGKDVLLGGTGDDVLIGGEGRNLLVGGYAVYDGGTVRQDGAPAGGPAARDQAALVAVMRGRWGPGGSGSDFLDRNPLLHDGGDAGLVPPDEAPGSGADPTDVA
jgi:Ca2+-binding RTX toxin-like protein